MPRPVRIRRGGAVFKMLPISARTAKAVRTESQKAVQRAKRRVSKAREQEVITLLLRALRDAGLPVADLARGREHPYLGPFKKSHPFKLDLADTNKKIVIEIDGGGWSGTPCPLCGMRPGGRHNHGDRERERLKLNSLAAEGWLVLSFSTTAIERKIGQCVYLVREAYRCRS